ncbi:MAG: type III-B CRISPR module RAMP protein Cmr4 [Brevinematia bacterium]
MLKKEFTSIITFYAISPIHAGAGSSTSVVDLPIQRERCTNWPHIQASSVKGALRQHFRRFAGNEKRDNLEKKDKALINFIFGTDYDNDDEPEKEVEINSERINSPGAISVSDAKILAFPMRSNIAPFVHVTCPAVLDRLSRDLEFCGININNKLSYKKINDEEAISLKGGITNNQKIILEDVVVEVKEISEIKSEVKQISDIFENIERLLLVSDDIFYYCVSYCTEVQTQIKIDSLKGTTQDGSLRYQELLPSDTLLYSVVYYSASAFNNNLQAEMVKNIVEKNIQNFIQIGGDETLGRGICRIKWLSPSNNQNP